MLSVSPQACSSARSITPQCPAAIAATRASTFWALRGVTRRSVAWGGWSRRRLSRNKTPTCRLCDFLHALDENVSMRTATPDPCEARARLGSQGAGTAGELSRKHSTPGGVHAESCSRAGEPGDCCWAGDGGGAGHGGAAPPTSAPPSSEGNEIHSDDLPNPVEEKRGSCARKRSGRADGARAGRAARGRQGGQGREDRRADGAGRGSVRRLALKTDRSSSCSRSSATSARQGYPDQDMNKNIPGPATWNGPVHNASPGARPGQGQLHGLAAELRQGALRAGLLRRRRHRRPGEVLLRASRRTRPPQRRGPGHRLGEGPSKRGALRPLGGYPSRGTTCARTRGT